MPYVLTVDQIASRRTRDHVPALMATMGVLYPGVPITRTVGDEFQLLFAFDPVSVVDAILTIMREGRWHVGVGIGPVEEPISHDLREGRGPAFLAARRAVEEAKDRTDHLRVLATDSATAEGDDVQVMLSLVLALRSRRSTAGWEATDLADEGLTQAEIGERLGISRQAVNQRLLTAQWPLDVAARPVAARLLARAEEIAARRSETA